MAWGQAPTQDNDLHGMLLAVMTTTNKRMQLRRLK
jgi:hypothetical protein